MSDQKSDNVSRKRNIKKMEEENKENENNNKDQKNL